MAIISLFPIYILNPNPNPLYIARYFPVSFLFHRIAISNSKAHKVLHNVTQRKIALYVYL